MLTFKLPQLTSVVFVSVFVVFGFVKLKSVGCFVTTIGWPVGIKLPYKRPLGDVGGIIIVGITG